MCNSTVDLGFVVDFSSTITDVRKEHLLKEFVIATAMSLYMYAEGSHFSYIPYSTWPGDYTDNQWFNNSKVAGMETYNRTLLTAYLDDVVQRDPDTGFERGKEVFNNKFHFIKLSCLK